MTLSSQTQSKGPPPFISKSNLHQSHKWPILDSKRQFSPWGDKFAPLLTNNVTPDNYCYSWQNITSVSVNAAPRIVTFITTSVIFVVFDTQLYLLTRAAPEQLDSSTLTTQHRTQRTRACKTGSHKEVHHKLLKYDWKNTLPCLQYCKILNRKPCIVILYHGGLPQIHW